MTAGRSITAILITEVPGGFGNADYGDMGELAAQMRAKNVRPGIWFRPLYDHSADIPAEWRLERNAEVFDISVPEVLEHIAQDIRQLGDWGYELIKHDFSTYDIFGCWGFEMGTRLTAGSWRFHDHTKTTAELIVRFYEVVHEAAKREDRQDVLILGCNCIGHLGAGLMQGNRTGDEYKRCRMGKDPENGHQHAGIPDAAAGDVLRGGCRLRRNHRAY